MNGKFLRDQMIRLETNYGKERFQITKEIFELWKEMFADCNEQAFKLAVDKCIKENEFAPNIAGLMKYYTAIEAEHDELEETIKQQYKKICYFWGEKYDSETFKAIAEYIMRQPKKIRKVEMIELSQKAISYSHDCDACGRTDKPTLKAYIEGAR